VEVRRDYLTAQEEDFYQALYSQSQTQFASYVQVHTAYVYGVYIQAGTVLNHYAHIFELLSKLRQAAAHPFLVVHKNPSQQNSGTYVCGLCHDVAEEPIASKCKHVFCRQDIRYENFPLGWQLNDV
jgi:DNA repair protein RAD16